MQDEQKKFQEKLSELLSYARDHENKVTMKEVRDFFEDFALDEQKVTFVCEYLTMEQVDVADYEPGVVPEETEKEKKEAKKDKKDPKDAQIEDLTDRLRRTMAEFDNFRKRTEKEKAAMYEIGAKDIIEKILPVLDNFERGLAAVPEDEKGSSFAEGIEKIYKQFVKTLEDAGVETIEAVGQQFDPNLHNAVMHVEDEKYGENEIAMELQKGYKYRGSVVRHSMVQVAN
mgnify:CR=1 FL=1